MADPIFDKEGNLTNMDEMTVEEVATAYKVKNKEIHDARVVESNKANLAKEKADRLEKELEEERKKSAKPDVPPKKEDEAPAKSDLDPEELRLIARGLSEEEIDEAKAISLGKKIPLAEALKDKTFLLFQANLKEEQKKEKAKLGASSGSGQEESEIVFKPGMKTDEHKEAWNKRFGKA